MSLDSKQFVSKASFKYLSGTMLSRISGMTRDMIMAFCFGASAHLAAFLLAYRFIYLIRRLFGEGLLHQGFIPHFESKHAEDPKKGALFFRDLFWTLAVSLALLIVLAEWGLSFFDGEVIRNIRLMLPGILFICLFGLTSGLIQIKQSFFLPSVAPVAFNLVWILALLFFAHLPSEEAMRGLSLILLVAFFVQWSVILPKAWRFVRAHLSLKEIFSGRIFSKDLRALSTPILFGIVGVGAVQVNSAVDGLFARFASPEGPAHLWYAVRLQLLPLALFALSLSTALLPTLSRAFQSGDIDRYHSLIDFAKRRAYILILPCVMGIYVLGASSVNLLFGRGGFTQADTYQTTLCLWGYGIGLLPASLVQILAPAFYARKDYKTPMQGFLFSSIFNCALNALLVFGFHLGATSISIATSMAAVFNCIFLMTKLGTRLELTQIARGTLATMTAGALTLLFGHLILSDPTLSLLTGEYSFPRELSSQLGLFSLQTLLFFSVFLLLCKILRVKEILEVFSK